MYKQSFLERDFALTWCY